MGNAGTVAFAKGSDPFTGLRQWGHGTEAMENPQFEVAVRLGTIVVPPEYRDPRATLQIFCSRHKSDFFRFNPDVSDAHFNSPNRVLKPGAKFEACLYRQKDSFGATLSEQRIAFLRKNKSLLVGAQGLAIVWSQRADVLRGLDRWCVSFDTKNRLWADDEDMNRVPYVGTFPDRTAYFDLGRFQLLWDARSLFLGMWLVKE